MNWCEFTNNKGVKTMHSLNFRDDRGAKLLPTYNAIKTRI